MKKRRSLPLENTSMQRPADNTNSAPENAIIGRIVIRGAWARKVRNESEAAPVATPQNDFAEHLLFAEGP